MSANATTEKMINSSREQGELNKSGKSRPTRQNMKKKNKTSICPVSLLLEAI